jgi:hypothetical protein
VIDDLKLAIDTCATFSEREIVVSQKVFFEVVDRLVESGDGQVRMNTRQQNSDYPFLHTAYWRGITFMHFSRDALGVLPTSS